MEIEECVSRLLAGIQPKMKLEMVHITECAGRILGEDIIAGRMVPPFSKSAMDGYAVKAEDIAGAAKEHPVRLKVAGELLAGDYEEIPYKRNTSIRVMTGSFVPEGFDAVVRQEDTDYGEEEVCVYASVKPWTNYCAVGEDIQKGQIVLTKGMRLSALSVGLLAGLGEEWISVYEPAGIGILSTGTELVEVGNPLPPGKIYNSIAYMLAADIRREGLRVTGTETCIDDEELLQEKIVKALENSDMVITTGAVSVGKRDIVPEVLKRLGARTLFQRAGIQPGTPTMASVLGEKVILSLSGNPYAAIANFELYFWPAMAKMMQSVSFEVKTGLAVLDSPYTKVNRMRRLVRAYAAEGRVVIPTDVHASSVLGSLTGCNCFIDLEPKREVKPGDTVRIRFFKGQM